MKHTYTLFAFVLSIALFVANAQQTYAQCASYNSPYPPPYPTTYPCMNDILDPASPFYDSYCCNVAFDEYCIDVLKTHCDINTNVCRFERCRPTGCLATPFLPSPFFHPPPATAAYDDPQRRRTGPIAASDEQRATRKKRREIGWHVEESVKEEG